MPIRKYNVGDIVEIESFWYQRALILRVTEYAEGSGHYEYFCYCYRPLHPTVVPTSCEWVLAGEIRELIIEG